MDMIFTGVQMLHTDPEFVMLYAVVRAVNVALSILLFVGVASRFRLWRSRPATYARMVGLGATLSTITILGAALDHIFRGVDPGIAGFGALAVLISLGAAVVSLPESDGRPSPLLRWLEDLGVRFRSRQPRR